MKVEKQKLKVHIISEEALSISGLVHINPGERLIDFLNNHDENFIAVTEARFSGPGALLRIGRSKDVVLVNKQSIKLIEKL